MRFGRVRHRIAKFIQFVQLGFSKNAFGTLMEFLIYHSPLKHWWAGVRGDRFHRSTQIWFLEEEGIHTRATFLLPRLKLDYPQIEKVDIDFEFYTSKGVKCAHVSLKDTGVKQPYVLDSSKLPPEFNLPQPFNGSLLVKFRLHMPDEIVHKRDGLFNASHTYIDYYKPGAFVTTLHDYAAFLPSEGLQQAVLGMIPAYVGEQETFLIGHATRAGRGARDLVVELYNSRGAKRTAPLKALKPFETQRIRLTELFGDASAFLGGEIGQIMIRGLFRQVLTRMAYGIENKTSRTFSLDHCYYPVCKEETYLQAQKRKVFHKGSFNPFLVVEDEDTTTLAAMFQSQMDSTDKHVEVLIYDAQGKLVVQKESYAHLHGDQVRTVPIRALLEEAGLSIPFTGHAEILHNRDETQTRYRNELDLYVEYGMRGKLATVIFGACFWNPSKPARNKKYRSCCRIVCNEDQTTHVAITNCSFDRNYSLTIDFTISLVAGDKVVGSKRMAVGPNATIFEPIEYFFPDAQELLKSSGGVGYTTTTDINGVFLTHLFFSKDRRSGAISVEHSLDV